MKWRTPYTAYDSKNFGLSCKLPSKAKQADKDMFNPNTVMKMFRRTGDLNVFNQRKGYYADISHLSSMSSYMDVQAALEPIVNAFYSLPSDEREKFGHDPIKFLDFTKNPANIKWLVKYGFIEDPDLVKTKLSSSPTEGKSDVTSEEVKAP